MRPCPRKDSRAGPPLPAAAGEEQEAAPRRLVVPAAGSTAEAAAGTEELVAAVEAAADTAVPVADTESRAVPHCQRVVGSRTRRKGLP